LSRHARGKSNPQRTGYSFRQPEGRFFCSKRTPHKMFYYNNSIYIIHSKY